MKNIRANDNTMKENQKQHNSNLLLEYFDRLLPLDEAEKKLVTERFHPRLYRKRQYSLQEGDMKSLHLCNKKVFTPPLAGQSEQRPLDKLSRKFFRTWLPSRGWPG